MFDGASLLITKKFQELVTFIVVWIFISFASFFLFIFYFYTSDKGYHSIGLTFSHTVMCKVCLTASNTVFLRVLWLGKILKLYPPVEVIDFFGVDLPGLPIKFTVTPLEFSIFLHSIFPLEAHAF